MGWEIVIIEDSSIGVSDVQSMMSPGYISCRIVAITLDIGHK